MGVFKRSQRIQKSLLPEDTLDHLEAWGRNDFDNSQEVGFATVRFVSSFEIDPAIKADPSRAAQEIYDVAIEAGGWAAYGGWRVIHAFLPSEADSAICDELLTARVRFLRGLSLPDLRMHLSPVEVVRYKELYPSEL